VRLGGGGSQGDAQKGGHSGEAERGHRHFSRGSGFGGDDDGAEFGRAGGLRGTGRRLGRPREGHADDLAAAHFSRRFDHEGVLAGRKARELCAGERDLMLARRLGGAADPSAGIVAVRPALRHH